MQAAFLRELMPGLAARNRAVGATIQRVYDERPRDTRAISSTRRRVERRLRRTPLRRASPHDEISLAEDLAGRRRAVRSALPGTPTTPSRRFGR